MDDNETSRPKEDNFDRRPEYAGYVIGTFLPSVWTLAGRNRPRRPAHGGTRWRLSRSADRRTGGYTPRCILSCAGLRRRATITERTCGPEIRNPKHEIRNKSKIPNHKSETRRGLVALEFVLSFEFFCFGFVSDFGFRVSDLGSGKRFSYCCTGPCLPEGPTCRPRPSTGSRRSCRAFSSLPGQPGADNWP